MSSKNSIYLNFDGLVVKIDSDFISAIKAVAHDFSYFVTPPRKGGFDLQVDVLRGKVTARNFNGMIRSKHSKVAYGWDGEQRVLYFNRALVKYHYAKGQAKIKCQSSSLAYEMLYTVLLSFVGESFDRRGWHRIHGLGMSYGPNGMILLARSGGGKSTLGFELLKHNGWQWLSDDFPLVNKKGEMKAWPLRFGFSDRPSRSTKYRSFERIQYGKKFVVSASELSAKVTAHSPVKYLIILDKNAKRNALERIPKAELIWPLMKWLVIGYEVPQMAELFLRPSAKDIVVKSKVLQSRLLTMKALLNHVEAYRLKATSVQAGRRMLEAFAAAKH